VYCQLDYLSGCLPSGIQQALSELPETLDGTYERTLREIKSTNWEFARRLFLCVAVASRPLRVEELAEFLAFDFTAKPIPKFREDWRPEDPLEAVLSTCSTFLVLVNVGHSSVIQFSHFSVKEFLTSARLGENRDSILCRHHVSMTPAHTFLAQACLAILLHMDENVTEDSLEKFPLVEYAAEHWFEHARFEGVSENAEEAITQLFDGNQPHLAIWIWIYDPRTSRTRCGRAKRSSQPLGTPLHYAALCGLHYIVEQLAIGHPRAVRSWRFDDQSTPLHLASRGGHVEVARSLVKHGADVKAKDYHRSTPLHLAMQEGSVDLARLLVEHGAYVRAKDKDGWTPLHLAVRERSVDLTRFLVKNGADLKAKVDDGWTPLHLAVREGSVDLARLLVEHGADLEAKDDHRRTPLHLVMWEDSVDLACLLVEHGADLKAKDNKGWTPLHSAVSEGSVYLARLLVEHGADLNAKDNDGLTPLHLALQAGNVGLARLLVKHGADLKAETGGLHCTWRLSKVWVFFCFLSCFLFFFYTRICNV
jgi:ankyrin repeat protein